ncbi:Polysaccharide pyruvyl transferase family protein WcaK [Nocardioides terrae]|uniref:Polysaccharide pyruvyl transferase family protein WcaK n=1 Tax=Nocardioides terrae TaxID=574651 RepID=A0A1I1HSZ0_9ACTN|nr:polysaccharide pyruvyl transferase family protein [Nocardioides terrae]SFC27197.1 Polysaccharide pyruvyl transferase family protein WcaK [Nocardioides terrae]
MRVLVLWADDESANLGVRALGAGTSALVRRVWPDAEISFLSFGSRAGTMRIGGPRPLIEELVRPSHGVVEWLRTFDLVVDLRAGDSFTDIYGLRRHTTMSLVAEAVHRARRPYVLAPQTIGPFETRRGRMLARRTLAIAAMAMARDSASASAAAGLGRPVDVRSTDVVFALGQPQTETVRDVVLNISGLLWQPGPHVDSQHYRSVVQDVYEEMRKGGRKVTLLAHVVDSPVADNDVPAIKEFAEVVGHDGETVIPSSLDEVRELLAGSQLVIGSRMHACLNALSVGTPAIPLAYSRKFAPLLADLGWGHSVDLRSEPRPQDRVVAIVEAGIARSEAAGVRRRAEGLIESAITALRHLS